MVFRNSAVENFKLNTDNWNRPKPKILFWVDFRLHSGIDGSSFAAASQTVSPFLSFMVKTTDKPQYNSETTVYNQYNRKRVVHGPIKYEPVRMMFYDDVENSAFKLYNQYRSFYYGDFQDKTLASWQYDTTSGSFESTAQNWGLSTVNNYDGEQSYFFSSIDIYEFYQNSFTVYNLIHPKITSFEMDPRDVQAEAISEVTVSFEYEGVTHKSPYVDGAGDHINYGLNEKLAKLAKLPDAKIITPPKHNTNARPDYHPSAPSSGQEHVHQQTVSQGTLAPPPPLPPPPLAIAKNLNNAVSYGSAASSASILSGARTRIQSTANSLFSNIFGR